MLIKQKTGNLTATNTGNKIIDWLGLEWHEVNKRIMHKRSDAGVEVMMKFMDDNQNLTQGDILYEDAGTIIAVNIQPCDAIIICPKTMYEMACVCYEIGNKHLPLFFENEEVLVAYDAPLFRMLTAAGYDVKKETRKLVNPVKSSVAPHGHIGGSETLFSKIMRLTNSPE